MGVELVDIAGGLASIAALAFFCRVWRPADRWSDASVAAPGSDQGQTGVKPGSDQGQTGVRLGSDTGLTPIAEPSPHALARGAVARAWAPWLFLSIAVIIWGLPATKRALTGPVLAPAARVP